MKLVCFLAVALALCAGAQANTCKSFDLVKGSPVSVSVEFDRADGYCVQSLSPPSMSTGGGGRRHLLQLDPPANISSIVGAAEALPFLTGNPPQDANLTAQNSTNAGRRLLSFFPQYPEDIKDIKDWKPSEDWKNSEDWKKSESCPQKFKVPISVKKSALGGFVTIAVDLSGADATAVLEYFHHWKYTGPYCQEAAANVQILVYPEAEGPEIVDVISNDFFLGSDGKGLLETFGLRGDVDTFQTCKYEPDEPWKKKDKQIGARIFLAIEIQEICWGVICSSYQFIIPAKDFTVEKFSLPTAQGIWDTLCE